MDRVYTSVEITGSNFLFFAFELQNPLFLIISIQILFNFSDVKFIIWHARFTI